jgi:pyruvate kinase
MPLPKHKTKIVATMGPACDSPEMLERLIRAGMNIARLNFSHGDFLSHRKRIENLRAVEQSTGRSIAIMADLPGPKIRIGRIEPEPIELRAGQTFVLTTEDVIGDLRRVSVSFDPLPRVVRSGDVLFLNDGQVQLQVERTEGKDVFCRVVAGGELRSRKGLNLPGIDLGISAFTDHDRDCLAFAMAHGADAISQSFVEKAADIEALRDAAQSLGRQPFLVAKIERAGAIAHLDEILAAADGVMIARGDLGVEVPIERIAATQKEIVQKANGAGKPVITATQMLESMVSSRLPTRAEATDVANAILDGSDAVMLSAESAVGRFPEEAVAMLAKIAAATETMQRRSRLNSDGDRAGAGLLRERFAGLVQHAMEVLPCAMALVPTRTGTTARLISSFKPRVWIVALSPDRDVCQGLQFSYGVQPYEITTEIEDWRACAVRWASEHRVDGAFALLVAGPSAAHPEAHHRLEFIPLK